MFYIFLFFFLFFNKKKNTTFLTLFCILFNRICSKIYNFFFPICSIQFLIYGYYSIVWISLWSRVLSHFFFWVNKVNLRMSLLLISACYINTFKNPFFFWKLLTLFDSSLGLSLKIFPCLSLYFRPFPNWKCLITVCAWIMIYNLSRIELFLLLKINFWVLLILGTYLWADWMELFIIYPDL